ncbi:MAG: DUF1501 domain-containing protein [Chloroflexi bacterium]|nr:DUF1501 domain-containing protein [Chloroflexota bacterium]MCI0801402.1 DUF1501 domain-containing protein [Chloroflexota bacterium]MCI0812122.1 DUF1501 domain-containing protein [Chloroflexota bacterium]MCI0828904.1 DUF1501 domain-containing protein [Chloroflexota bacterium]MCI0849189.1 DUF1501 domain-containing protein [Chloroflexota bacterium]
MTSTKKDPILVVVQLTGGSDYMNMVVPHADPLYYDNRPTVGIPAEDVLPINDRFGFNPALGTFKDLYDQGQVAVINGVGYPNPNRSHFRAMDIWHTCEPEKIATEGWLGRVIRDIDPSGENVLTGVNFGRGLPRAMALTGVPVASVAVLEGYGVLTGISGQEQRARALDLFARMYSPAIGTGAAMDYLGRTGLDALKGADILKTAADSYTSTVEYAETSIARSLRGMAQVILKDLGTRVFYTSHGGYDTHANQVAVQTPLLSELSAGIGDFFADLKEHDAAENVMMLVFTEFGRRVKDNGSGSDHGSGGASYIIGQPVKGGMLGEYPSLKEEDQLDGDLRFQVDFRSVYSTIVEEWLGLDAKSVTGGSYEHLAFV